MLLNQLPEGAATRYVGCDYKDIRVEGDGIYTSDPYKKTKLYTPRKLIQRISLWVQPYEGPCIYF